MAQLYQGSIRRRSAFGLAHMMRLGNSSLMGIAVIASEFVAKRGFPSFWQALVGFCIAFFLTAGVMVTNDYFDKEIDRINRPDRPIPSGMVSERLALIASFIFFVAGLTLSLAGPWYLMAFPLALFSLVISLEYNYKLKRKGLIGNAIVSFNVALPFLYGSIMVGQITSINALFFGYAFQANMAREIIKGVPDMQGDKNKGVRTIAVVYGPSLALKIGFVIVFLDVLASPVPYIIGSAGFLYLIVLAVGDAILLHSSLYMMLKKNEEAVKKGKNEMLLGMAIVILAFFVSPL